jgi:rhodanese-related sulfurtransferase
LVPVVSAIDLRSTPPDAILFVDTSQDFARGHIPGANWVPRGWLEWQVSEHVASTDASVVVVCGDGRQSLLAAATLRGMGYVNAAALDGGMGTWRQAGLPLETGLSGVMRTPADVVFSGPDRTYADMQNYLRWEERLGDKYAAAD